MNLRFDHVGQVRRIDVHLRHRYPHLVTKIFEVAENRFVITFDSALQDASVIAEEFHRSIRFITAPVTVANTAPENYLREIPTLSDADALGDTIGLPLRTLDLRNLLSSRFPDIAIADVEDDVENRTARIILSERPDAVTEERVRRFVRAFELPVVPIIDVVPGREETPFEPPENQPMFVWASRLRPRAPDYVREDEEFWFENIESIASGAFELTSFPGIRPAVSRCYMDLTTGGAFIDLRQALLLYDEVWCSAPLEVEHGGFLNAQSLTEADLLRLVESGRLRLVTTQPEERLNVRFLEAAKERSGVAVLGRRTTAALLVQDIVHTAEASYLNDPKIHPVLCVLCDELSRYINMDSDELLRLFLWPTASRRGCLEPLLDLGSWGSPVADLADLVAGHVRTNQGVDVELETRILSPAVHLAHALDGTLFGQLDQPPAWHFLQCAVARHLGFHRYFRKGTAAAWVENEVRREQGTRVVPALRLFDFDPRIPIEELLDDSGLWSTRTKGRTLYSRLSRLSAGERQDEVDDLERELRTRSRQRAGFRLDLESLDTGMATIALIADFVFPPLAGLTKIGKGVLEVLRKDRRMDRMVLRLEEKSYSETERELDFMSRIGRVATFERDVT